ncbi:MAG: hypothetical protein KDJ90_11255 [Nitratireductor sp.]|nr:hypothetical protein [Nitratireductor sp.]
MGVHFRAILPPASLIGLAVLLTSLSLWMGWEIIAGLFTLGGLILVFDMRSRRRDFHNVRGYLDSGHEPAQVAKIYQYSWCSRAACQAAASLAGEEAERAISGYYRENGYRWFHIFPDNTFTLNSPFLKLRFWKITLFGNAGAKSLLDKAAAKAKKQAAGRAVLENARAKPSVGKAEVRRKAA